MAGNGQVVFVGRNELAANLSATKSAAVHVDVERRGIRQKVVELYWIQSGNRDRAARATVGKRGRRCGERDQGRASDTGSAGMDMGQRGIGDALSGDLERQGIVRGVDRHEGRAGRRAAVRWRLVAAAHVSGKLEDCSRNGCEVAGDRAVRI